MSVKRHTINVRDGALVAEAKAAAEAEGITVGEYTERALRALLDGGWLEVVTTGKAADIMGVHKPNVAKLEEQGRMPARKQTLPTGPLWWRHEVERLGRTLATERGERAAAVAATQARQAAKKAS